MRQFSELVRVLLVVDALGNIFPKSFEVSDHLLTQKPPLSVEL